MTTEPPEARELPELEPSDEEWIGELERLYEDAKGYRLSSDKPIALLDKLMVQGVLPRLLAAARERDATRELYLNAWMELECLRPAATQLWEGLAEKQETLAEATATIARVQALPAKWIDEVCEHPGTVAHMVSNECASELSAALSAHPSTGGTNG